MRKLLVILLNGGDIAWSVIIPEAGLQMQLSSITIDINAGCIYRKGGGPWRPSGGMAAHRDQSAGREHGK